MLGMMPLLYVLLQRLPRQCPGVLEFATGTMKGCDLAGECKQSPPLVLHSVVAKGESVTTKVTRANEIRTNK